MNVLKVDAEKETEKIVDFIKATFKKTGFNKVVIGLSGGIDSATSLYLLSKAIPVEHIHVLHLYYFTPYKNLEIILRGANIPEKNFYSFSIKTAVDVINKQLNIDNNLRLGNIMARMRMIYLYDYSKKYNALVCGTENKSEHFLGYFTRFGDEASDIEPIRSLYKTQIRELASFLNVPQFVIDQAPTAGLWKGQTDEDELGFSYTEADKILYYYFEQHKTRTEIKKLGFRNVEEVLRRVNSNTFKHHLPYILEKE